MNRTEAAQLLRAVRSGCPGQAIDEYTPDVWGLVLADYPYADALQVALGLIAQPLEPGRARYIEPGHIVGGIHQLRRQRLADAPPIDPPSGLDPAAYCAWLKRQRDAIADGHAPQPGPTHPADPARIAGLLRDATPGIDA